MEGLSPNAKINLGLRVVGKRQDGYHDLETIFLPVYGIHDDLMISSADTFSFVQEGLNVDCEESDNLVVRCYRMMREAFPAVGPVSICLRKNIPFGAGLGGGSSDAAHTAIGLNALFHLHLSREQLADIVRPLGADCPFFVYNTPCYAAGIGDRLSPIALSLRGLRAVLIKPEVSVSTREAYSGIVVHPEVSGQIVGALRAHQPLSGLFPLLVNDFEQTVFPLHPVLGEIKARLLEAGAVYAAMSGSGSTMYGLFPQGGCLGEERFGEFGRVWAFDMA